MPSHLLLSAIDKMIEFYQLTLSPDHSWLRVFFPGGVCRYRPTCSCYAREAIQKHYWRGLIMAARRVSRCHVFNPGGYDPVPL